VAAAALCGGSTGVRPLRLERGWQERARIGALATQPRPRGDTRRAAIAIASHPRTASPISDAPLVGTAQAEVYTMHGDDDLLHMDWRARLTLSSAASFHIPLPGALSRYWVH
jgi:hypothetical protein